MASKGYKITDAVKVRLAKARASIMPKVKNPNALKPNDPKYDERISRYRRENPEYRKQARQKYYDKTKVVAEITKRRPTGVPHRPWTKYECDAILNWDMCTDREIGKHFNRSVHAIQEKRRKLKKE
jgi:hypothetical protein